jgi:hypothetical protein
MKVIDRAARPSSARPLMWDTRQSAPQNFDNADSADIALEGEFTVDGVACRAALVARKTMLAAPKNKTQTG